MLQWLYTYVSSVCFKCFICFKRMLQVFYLDVAYVAVAIHVCCKCMFQMFHLFQTYVASVSSRYCICFRQMLRAFIQNVSSILNVYYKFVYLDVIIAIHIYCKRMFVNASSFSDVCYKSASYYNISRCKKREHGEAVPHAREAKRAWVVPACMRINRHVVCSGMHTCTACRHNNCMRHAGAGVQMQQLHTGQAPFHFFMSGAY
jgi:hypothetical protein